MPPSFPIAVAVLWIAIGSLIYFLGGWFRLMNRYPDRDEDSLATLRWQSGSMGLGISMSGVLTLNACRSGLRVKTNRLFGPFCRPFFVPWSEISVSRRAGIFVHGTELSFGEPAQGRLVLPNSSVERLLASAPSLQRELEAWRNPR